MTIFNVHRYLSLCDFCIREKRSFESYQRKKFRELHRKYCPSNLVIIKDKLRLKCIWILNLKT